MHSPVDTRQVVNDAYTSFQGINNLKYQAAKQSPEALKQVMKQFESLFMQMMLKSMRQTTSGNTLFDSNQSQMYTDLFDKQIAIKMSQNGGLGLGQMVQMQMRQMGLVPKGGKGTPSTGVNPTAPGLLKMPVIPGVTAGAPGTTKALDIKQAMSNLATNLKLLKQSLAKQPEAGTEVKQDVILNNPDFQARLKFVKSIWADVKQLASKLNVHPYGILAQSILETGWGKQVAKNGDDKSSNNIFGIKAAGQWNGKSITAMTKEFVGGELKPVAQNFRGYSNVKQSIADYGNLLQNDSRYEKVLKSGQSVKGFIQAMQESGYATDPEYGSKLMGIINGSTFKDVMKQLVM